MTTADLFRQPMTGAVPKPRIVATYDYFDEAEQLLFQVCRFEPKRFVQRQPDGRGGWTWGLDGVTPTLYRLPLLLARHDDLVFVVEGEKDVHALEALDLLATTSPMGAGKWRGQYSEALRGRHVAIVPDSDEAGRNHGQQVAAALHGIAASVRVAALDGLPEHGDVSDWLAAGHTASELLALVDAAPEWTPAQGPAGSIIEFPGKDGLEQPEFHRLSVNAWEYRPAGLRALRLVARRVTSHRDDISAWFEGSWDTPGGGPLFHDHVNFGSSTMPKTVATNACRYEGGLAVDELQVHIREFKRRVVDASFTAAQVTDLGEPDDGDQRHALVEGLIPGGVPVWVYGGRGSAKTLLDLYLLTCTYYGLPFLGFPTTKAKGMLCEFEETGRDMKPVLARVAKGLDVDVPHIPHLWCAGSPLRHQIDQIAETRTEFGASYIVVDSVLAAVSASGDYVSNADGVTMLMEAINSLGNDVGAILNDHINQADLKTGAEADPRDSGRKLDAARVAYQVQRLARETGSMRLKIRQAKAPMNAPPIEPFGVQIRWFQDGAIVFDRTDDLTPAATADDGDDQGVRSKMVEALGVTPVARPAELAMLCNLPANVVRARLTDAKGKQLFERLDDGSYRLKNAS